MSKESRYYCHLNSYEALVDWVYGIKKKKRQRSPSKVPSGTGYRITLIEQIRRIIGMIRDRVFLAPASVRMKSFPRTKKEEAVSTRGIAHKKDISLDSARFSLKLRITYVSGILSGLAYREQPRFSKDTHPSPTLPPPRRRRSRVSRKDRTRVHSTAPRPRISRVKGGYRACAHAIAKDTRKTLAYAKGSLVPFARRIAVGE
jgi:hypothetical protein